MRSPRGIVRSGPNWQRGLVLAAVDACHALVIMIALLKPLLCARMASLRAEMRALHLNMADEEEIVNKLQALAYGPRLMTRLEPWGVMSMHPIQKR